MEELGTRLFVCTGRLVKRRVCDSHPPDLLECSRSASQCLSCLGSCREGRRAWIHPLQWFQTMTVHISGRSFQQSVHFTEHYQRFIELEVLYNVEKPTKPQLLSAWHVTRFFFLPISSFYLLRWSTCVILQNSLMSDTIPEATLPILSSPPASPWLGYQMINGTCKNRNPFIQSRKRMSVGRREMLPNKPRNVVSWMRLTNNSQFVLKRVCLKKKRVLFPLRSFKGLFSSFHVIISMNTV